jgi:AcrR family transcriptional regulator
MIMRTKKKEELVSPNYYRMLSKASELFWLKGFHGTSMREIAKAYGCEPSNIYNFFSDKESIFFEILKEEMKSILSPILELEFDENTPVTEQLKHIIDTHLNVALMEKKPKQFMILDMDLRVLPQNKRQYIISLRDTYDRILRKVIRRGIEIGEFREIDEKLLGFNIAAMIVRTRIWFNPKGELSIRDISKFIYDFIINGISSQVVGEL